MARLLLVLVCAFAALSSSTAAALGLESQRIVLFSLLVAILLLFPFLFRPTMPRPSGLTVLVLVLLPAVGLVDSFSTVDPIDYKIVLPILVILAAPNLVRSFDGTDFVLFVWRLLAVYVTGTFLYQTLAEPAVVARGYEGIVRYDPTGSVVMHSSLSLIALVLAAARFPTVTGRDRIVTAVVAAMALGMLLLSASRTTLAALFFYACLAWIVAPDRGTQLRRNLLVLGCIALVLGIGSLLVSDSLVLRLIGVGNDDYSSGRWVSIRQWLSMLADRPMGLGLGAVREKLADGRPEIDGDSLLEWPHNEFVRFLVEAGPLGLLLVACLVAQLLGTALRAADLDDDPVRRTLILIVAADILAECCLQNFFNAIYHATVLILVLTIAAALVRSQHRRPWESTAPGQAEALPAS
ncbi:MAG: O-antigen ligase family protein [Geminicoccaceae bacterium]